MIAPKRVLSLGAGVQSSTMALMAERGEIEKPDAAGFADTQVEPEAVYMWLEWLEKKLTYPVARLSAGHLGNDSVEVRVSKKTGNVYSRNLIPAYLDKGNGKHGLLGRKCTAEYKVREIVAFARGLIGAKAFREWRQAHKKAWAAYRRSEDLKEDCPEWAWEEMQSDALCEMWIGISIDESHRMKPSREPWARSRWPLIEKGMTRTTCLEWMQAQGYPEPPRSACLFCPFHSDAEWVRIRDTDPKGFAYAVAFEKALQASQLKATGTARLKGTAYLHESLKPLDKVEFSNVPAHKQVDRFGNECEGMCGV